MAKEFVIAISVIQMESVNDQTLSMVIVCEEDGKDLAGLAEQESIDYADENQTKQIGQKQ
ncbi:MAG: hypothetical protein LQ352_001105 [Teloschistes flavicans]|nr:MAG: hypothetical protein LQ352_001105 [Teloschistes flavicans]